MTRQKVVVALDFDGVIMDSLGDSFFQSVLAFKEMGGEVQASRAVEKQFRAGRALAEGAGSYFTLLRLIQENPRIDFRKMARAAFDAELQKDGPAKGLRFDRLVTKNRQVLAEKNPEKWFALQRVFPGVKRLVGNLQKKHEVFFASGKDKQLIVRLLERNDFNIPEKNIVSGNKAEQLRKISRAAGVPLGRVILVDDSLGFLREAKKIGGEAALAKWGYCSRAQRRQARREGIARLRVPRVFGRSLTLQSRLRKMSRKK